MSVCEPPVPTNGVLPIPQPDVAPISLVLAALDLTQIAGTSFTAPTMPSLGGRIYGGQVLAQAMIAAGRTIAEDRTLHSCHGYFLRPGATDSALRFDVEELHDGRSFSTRRVHAIQHGKPILSVIASFQEAQPGRTHQDVAPRVFEPEMLPSAIELFEKNPHPAAKFLSRTGGFDIRHVGGNMFLHAAPDREASQCVWMRARSGLPGGSSQLLHRALLLYACDQIMLEPVLRRHALSWLHPGLSVASLDHSMWWHRDVDVTDWFLFEQHSPSAQGGRGLGTAKIFDATGRLVASTAQEGMVRVPEDSPAD